MITAANKEIPLDRSNTTRFVDVVDRSASAMTRLATTHGAWYFGYRYLNIDVRPNDQALSVDLHGPVVGYGFTF